MKEMKDLKDDLQIDKHSLDSEWVRQPNLFDKYSKELIEIEYQRDFLKEKIEIAKAQLELEIRSAPKNFGLKDKPTEGSIKAVVATSKDIQGLTNEYLECSKDVKTLGVAVKRIDSHRKKALEKLVDLFLAGYFSKPKINETAVKESSEKVKLEENQKLKTRRRKKKGD